MLLGTVAAKRGDRYLFRVADQVIGVEDMGQAHVDLTTLECHFSDALLIEYLGEGFLAKLEKEVAALSKLTTPLGEQTPLVIFLSAVRQKWKLMVYVDSQEVDVAADLEKGLLKSKGCAGIAGSDGKIRGSFRKWLRVEIYLRSRYGQGKTASDTSRRDKRLQSINLFVDSLDKQVTHEDFW
jgi:hypothetical protein